MDIHFLEKSMRTERLKTFWIRIYMSGPIEVAKHIMRRECLREGLCVTINPTSFIYKGGEETGFEIGLINYPRFPVSQEDLINRARELMHILLDETYQESALMMTPDLTEWVSKREGS